MTDDQFLDAIIAREGREYTNRGDDRGGPTKFGITLLALSHHRGTLVTPEDVAALTEDEARTIYKANYITGPGIAKIQNEDVRAAVLDAAVMSGPANGIKMLQRALRLKDDGIIGPVTLAAVPYLNGRTLALRVVAENIRFLGRLVTKDLRDNDKDGIPDNTEMASGWFNRKADQIDWLS